MVCDCGDAAYVNADCSTGTTSSSSPICFTTVQHTITYKSRLTQKKLYNKPMLFLASMGETGLSHDIFFKFSLWPFEVIEAEGGRLVKEADFEAEKKILLK